MAVELDTRRRRAAFRANHRGTKELDIILGRYADARLPTMDEAALARFEILLTLPDPDLQHWIFTPADAAGSGHADLIADVRAFHGLTS